MRDKFIGFTLAEVLITLTIIGIVAAFTIPTLYSAYQKNQYVTQLKQVYTELSQAIKLMMADEGINKLSASNTLTCQNLDGEDCNSIEFKNKVADNFFKKYFKVIKDCGVESPSTCFPDDIKDMVGNDNGGIYDKYCVIIAGGQSICITPAASYMGGTFIVDVNGLKKPNVAGRDIFAMSFYYDGSIDESATPECRKGIANPNGLCNYGHTDAVALREERFNAFCNDGASGYGYGCFGKILNDNWKMDY